METPLQVSYDGLVQDFAYPGESDENGNKMSLKIDERFAGK